MQMTSIKVYGGKPKVLKAPYGSHIGLKEIEVALRTKKYRAITITHVDTSTGVLSDVKAIAATVRRTSPDTLVVVDGVCSVGSEELKMDAWGLDVVTTVSQIYLPDGLVASDVVPRMASKGITIAAGLGDAKNAHAS
ncbi:Alanine--glyoxylate aminotransferase 1 [Termitomyces sp. J132]|nr:Alanine--glyoxylate aminotransferase 1 [Termitomyces sp. J132]